MKDFSDYHLMVFCCEHVFRDERPVLYVCREDGDWQFLCGESDHPKSSDPVVVGIGHLTDADSTLSEIVSLLPSVGLASSP
jgi:hypothetical protein